MVQTIKAYKNMKTTLKTYKSNIGTKHKSYISVGTKCTKENTQYKLKVLEVSPLQNDEKL